MQQSLINAVQNQLGCDDEQHLNETCADISKHGIDGGFGSFIYYSDTVPFFNENREGILALAKEQSADFGIGMFEMIAGFNCLNDVDADDVARAIYEDTEDSTYVRNALAWYAAEEVARYIVDA